MSHTPGPWRVDDGPASETWQVWRNGSPEWIADVWTNEADARLIAAVPELLNLVTRFRQWDMLDSVSDGPYWRSECDRVIAKAEGRAT